MTYEKSRFSLKHTEGTLFSFEGAEEHPRAHPPFLNRPKAQRKRVSDGEEEQGSEMDFAPNRTPVQNRLRAQRSGSETERRSNGAVRALGEAGSE